MKTDIGIGFSAQKDVSEALNEAARKAHQDLKALQADFYFIVYTYDYALDSDLFASISKRVFRQKPVAGCSTWSAWTGDQMSEGEAGLFVLAFRGLAPVVKKVHSLKEKQGLWATELSRQIESLQNAPGLSLFVADSLHFTPGQQLAKVQALYPEMPLVGWGSSYGIPQCSVLAQNEIYSNALISLSFENVPARVACIQSVQAEGESIRINRMSENLIIEIDEKPAFYRLCEHLVEVEDLPMMPQDEFRKHMGQLYLLEKSSHPLLKDRLVGDFHRSISLLGSELTTGMVAVSESLDFSREFYLGQKKMSYFEQAAEKHLAHLKEFNAKPSFVWMIASGTLLREKDAARSTLSMVESIFPESKIFGVSSQTELAWGPCQNSLIVIAFP